MEERIVKNEKELNTFEQVVSNMSENNAGDTFFAYMKEELERRMLRFRQTMNTETFKRFSDALAMFDDEQDVMGNVFEEKLKQYFDTIIEFLEMAVDKRNRSDKDRLIYSYAVEELYLINCDKVKRDNIYRIYGNHPILLMNKRLDEDTKKMLKEKENNTKTDEVTLKETDYKILYTVSDTKMRNRRRMRLYGRNMVYETTRIAADDPQKFICAKPFKLSDECTEIPIIRIWEKIKNYKELHQEESGSINIAVFGSLKKYSDDDKKLVEKLSDVKINCTSFRYEPMTGEYFFTSETGEEIYDLMDMNDLQMLVDHYQIIIFLDMNCFYRQGQAEKDVEEKSVDTTCRWNFEKSQRYNDFRDKAAIYRIIYNRIGQWINSSDSNMSAFFEFDERLYRNLSELPKEKTDIYLYIRYGDNIGEYNLSNNGICNDEYYDGTYLTVCRLTKLDNEQFNKDYKAFLYDSGNDKKNVENKDKELYVPIRFWKLLKSISNEYCDNILEEFGKNDIEKLKDIIYFLNESCLVLYYSINSKEEKVSIQYELKIPENPRKLETHILDGLQKKMAYIAEIILKYAFGKEKLYCMNRYFERLLIYSVISNAGDVGDLIFAYWLASHWYTINELNEKSQENPETINTEERKSNGDFKNSRNRFKVRKTIYSIVKRLADMRMRNIPDMEKYFSASFHGEVCPEITDENLDRTYQRVSDYCERLKYTGGYLYSNSMLLMDK